MLPAVAGPLFLQPRSEPDKGQRGGGKTANCDAATLRPLMNTMFQASISLPLPRVNAVTR